jgi:hypothetical protein
MCSVLSGFELCLTDIVPGTREEAGNELSLVAFVFLNYTQIPLRVFFTTPKGEYPVPITNRFMRSSVVCAALLGATLLGAITFQPKAAHAAAKPAKVNAEHGGKVTAVDTTASTITIEHGKKTPKTFSVTTDTKISVDGVSGKTLADVTTNMHAKIESPKKAMVALSIEATNKKHKK